MGLEINSITIKSPGDLQEALRVDQESKDLAFDIKRMIERWGLDSALNMLAIALCGDNENLKPLINFTHKFYINPDDFNEYYLVDIDG